MKCCSTAVCIEMCEKQNVTKMRHNHFLTLGPGKPSPLGPSGPTGPASPRSPCKQPALWGQIETTHASVLLARATSHLWTRQPVASLSDWTGRATRSDITLEDMTALVSHCLVMSSSLVSYHWRWRKCEATTKCTKKKP